MRLVVRMMRATLLVAVVGMLLSAGAWAQSEEQQSLGDAARKQREKKAQEEQKEKKAFSNEDLPQGTATSGSEPASSSSGAQASEEKSAAAKEGEPAKAEDQESSMTKEQQADAAKQELDALKHDEASVDNGIKRLEEKLANETSDSLREVYSNALKHAQQNLADTQKKRAEAEKKLAEKAAAAQAAPQGQPPQEQPPQ